MTIGVMHQSDKVAASRPLESSFTEALLSVYVS